VTTLYGLLDSHGVFGILELKDIDDSDFWPRFIFDLTFWITINLILINILLGIIIDSFNMIRS
jgi:hypothetical protein